MLKRAVGLLMGLLMLAGTAIPALAAEPEESAPAYTVIVNEKSAAASSAGVLDGTLYVSLCTTALALRPDADVDCKDDQMFFTAEDFTLSAAAGAGYLVVNGRYLYLPHGVRMDETGADLMVPADTLAYALGAALTQDDKARTVQFTLTGEAKPLASGDTYYDAAQVDLLARVIRNESGSEPLAGQIAVGNVLLNRVASPIFPNTLAEVIAQPGQFPGTTVHPPTESSIIAAKLCLDGAVVLPKAYWFNRAGLSCWASRNKTLVATIGGHAFYG